MLTSVRDAVRRRRTKLDSRAAYHTMSRLAGRLLDELASTNRAVRADRLTQLARYQAVIGHLAVRAFGPDRLDETGELPDEVTARAGTLAMLIAGTEVVGLGESSSDEARTFPLIGWYDRRLMVHRLLGAAQAVDPDVSAAEGILTMLGLTDDLERRYWLVRKLWHVVHEHVGEAAAEMLPTIANAYLRAARGPRVAWAARGAIWLDDDPALLEMAVNGERGARSYLARTPWN